jgi:hypothetical protein
MPKYGEGTYDLDRLTEEYKRLRNEEGKTG